MTEEEVDAILNKLNPESCSLYDEYGKYIKSDSFLQEDDIDNLLNSPGINQSEIKDIIIMTIDEFNKLRRFEENLENYN